MSALLETGSNRIYCYVPLKHFSKSDDSESIFFSYKQSASIKALLPSSCIGAKEQPANKQTKLIFKRLKKFKL
tara:strand:- start:257 stop:475 length:219 start_codon:yes stop_codon:yes gene_type:complete